MLEITELIMRIPNLSEEGGRYIGDQVSRHIARQLPGIWDSRFIEKLELQLPLPANATPDELAVLIAGAIINKIINGAPRYNPGRPAKTSFDAADRPAPLSAMILPHPNPPQANK